MLVRNRLAAFGLAADPVLEEIACVVREADLTDDRYDTPDCRTGRTRWVSVRIRSP